MGQSVESSDMKVVILAGGLGTRLAEETGLRPKPMVEIGGHPILWHVMNIYAGRGYCDFLVACGYKAHMIKEYFHNFIIHNSDYRIDLRDGSQELLNSCSMDWRACEKTAFAGKSSPGGGPTWDRKPRRDSACSRKPSCWLR